jgi:hypothetical protein
MASTGRRGPPVNCVAALLAFERIPNPQVMTTTMYIKDVIDLPERVQRGDFVLRLSEGVVKPKETIESYVVTPQLVKCFDEAMALIRSAVDSRSSKACYLHGSYGSGKSHFMAILHLILMGNSDARSIPELAPVISRHSDWMEGKKFLLVPYHMIGAESMESAILGGYADHVHRMHPNASVPGVFRAEKMFKDAENLRRTMGDEAFFDKLNEGTAAREGWGEIGASWDATRFAAAVDAPPRDEGRVRLVGDLVEKFFTAARGHAEFVSLDEGLSIISKHSRSLGYDAAILFLDELILWLATHSGDLAFVQREGAKLSKLVEAQTADRPAPVISFVARQRDLRDLIGDTMPGVNQLNFSDILKHWEARFSKITLEDRNLPEIAAKRVLKPKSEAARQAIDDEFKKTASIREEVLNVLLTSQANREMFRKVYPFSPALVETLVAVSFMLQRERTALKVMLQLLVEQRDRLKLGDIVPVGDLFDAISEGDEAFSDVMKIQFDNAKKLYEQKLRPLLEVEHGLRFDELGKLSVDDVKASALRNDDRLVKTLLLSALASNVESLRGLTASRLAALNHGTIKSPVPGREYQTVVARFRKWAGEVGQIKIGDESNNPTISIQLTGVDTEAIIQQAQSADNTGNRIRKVKDILFNQLGITPQDELFLNHDFTWRATKRGCDVLVTNVRELTDASLKKEGDQWRVIIDYPFDAESFTPRDDIAKIEVFRSVNETPTRTLVWLPSFLSLSAKKDLGTLVKLDYILTGDRLPQFVAHLSPVERNDAKTLLTNQRDQLLQRMIRHLDGAYSIVEPERGSIDTTNELTGVEHFQSLDDGLTLQPPVGANLQQAFLNLLDQALRYQYPAHPVFDDDVSLTPATLKRVYAEVERATQDAEGRIFVDGQPRRKELRQIANPLKLGEMHETHFVLGHHWRTHFLRKESQHGGPMTVAKLRAWMDEPSPMGLPRPVQNLVLMVFAAQTNRSFFLHGMAVMPAIESLSDDLELREQRLPSQAEWEIAIHRGEKIFGLTTSPLLNAANLAKFVDDLLKAAQDAKAPCDDLAERLRQLLPTLSEQGTETPRYKTAQSAQQLLDAILGAQDGRRIEAMAGLTLNASEEAIEKNVRKASALLTALASVKWNLLEAVRKLADDRRERGEAIWDSIKDAFRKDEYAVTLAQMLQEAENKAVRLLSETPKPTEPPVHPLTGANEESPPGYTVIAKGSSEALTENGLNKQVDEIRHALKSDKVARVKITWEVFKR